MKLVVILIFFYSVFVLQVYGNDKNKNLEKKTKIELESEIIDFRSIRSELKKDGLDSNAKVFNKTAKKIRKTRIKKLNQRYSYPKEDVFWNFFSEYWLVKNAQLVKWDFQKPDYGLIESFVIFLEKFGFYNKKIKILYVNSPNLSHMALPSLENEYIFLISVPFIRTLDLSKLEISLLLFEDFLRIKAGYFKKNIENTEVLKLLGKSFHKNKMNEKIFLKLLKSYDMQVFENGFNFQQQFNITKLMNSYLINNMKMWNVYYKLLGKIDFLVKSNILYKKYNKIYPSPELQLNWLKPKTKR